MGNLTLYKIEQDALALEQLIYEAGGEVCPALETFMEEVQKNLEVKVDAYNAVIERMELSSDLMKSKSRQYGVVAQTMANTAERLKDRIKASMLALGKEEITGEDIRFKLSNTKPALVLEEKIDSAYMMQITETVPDKERIRAALVDGFAVTGAQLIVSKSLRRYAAKKGA